MTQELNQAKLELKDANKFKEKAQNEPLILGNELITGTLQTINQFQRQKKILVFEKELLAKRVQQLEELNNSNFDTEQKRRYMEGAVWMGQRLSNEIESLCNSLDYLLDEYNNRIYNSTGNAEKIITQVNTATQWLMQAIKSSGCNLYEKSIQVLEGATLLLKDVQENE